MNKLGYVFAGIAYVLLSLAYIFRGSIHIGNFVYKIEHRHMQLVVSVLYMTLGYIYVTDGVYHQFDDAFENEKDEKDKKDKKDEKNKKKEKKVKYIKLLAIYILLMLITIYIGKKYVSMEKKDHH